MSSHFLRKAGLAATLALSLAGSAWAQGAPGSVAVTTLFPGGGSAPPRLVPVCAVRGAARLLLLSGAGHDRGNLACV